jgi:hypothetical protein
MRRVIAAFLFLTIGFSVMGLAPTGAFAAQPAAGTTNLNQLIDKVAAAKQVTYRNRCVYTYRRCRNLYGGAYLFRNCMRWRGCWDYWNYLDVPLRDDDDDDRPLRREYSCDYYRQACAENWGYGNNDYYGCLRYHRCN